MNTIRNLPSDTLMIIRKRWHLLVAILSAMLLQGLLPMIGRMMLSYLLAMGTVLVCLSADGPISRFRFSDLWPALRLSLLAPVLILAVTEILYFVFGPGMAREMMYPLWCSFRTRSGCAF